ncbi:MAG: Sb-PDE family phosphodiesterase [Flavobacteriaceae bacterium]
MKALFISSLFLLLATFVKAQSPFFSSVKGYWISTDLHIHTVFSDGNVWPTLRVEEARREGLDLIALTEHLEYQPHAEDIPHPDRNRSYRIATEGLRESDKLQVINGSEITREMPPGHINAVFIKDANALLHSDSLSGIQQANKQGAFVFWNHPNWDAHRDDGIARLEPFHHYLIKNGLLHGIEVVNETTFSEEAFQIALTHNLTIIGTSDIHGLTDWAHDIAKGGHRPMTFVHVEERTPEAVKRALFDRKTVVWFNDMILGKEASVKKVLSENLQIENPSYPEDKTILGIDLVNKSALPIQLEYTGSYSFHEHASVFTLPPYSNMRLKIKTQSKNTSIALPFRVLNAYVGPKKNLSLTLETN